MILETSDTRATAKEKIRDEEEITTLSSWARNLKTKTNWLTLNGNMRLRAGPNYWPYIHA
jgi:hypothetical protein